MILPKCDVSGKVALELNEGDCLIGAGITNGSQEVMLVSDAGKAIRFPNRLSGQWVEQPAVSDGMKLSASQKVMTLIIVDERCTLLTATTNGYGQRTITWRIIVRLAVAARACEPFK